MKVFTCIGIKQFENKEGKVGTNIFYSTPFDEYEGSACFGEKVGSIFTYKSLNFPSVGDKFHAYYSSGFSPKTGQSFAVLEDIVLLKDK